ncbi:MAG: hypothetical protein J6Q78_01305 [Clostridia bacterium]|nr:hypothetical protein [Clostridia bacterium]
MKKRIIKIIALLLLSILPFAAFVVYTESIDNQYKNTYLAEFSSKYDRLYETEGKKIIFIGGSSLPFGLRSDLIEEELGGEYSVVNYGLYATLGTKFMMDTSKDAISDGDIVVLCPELNGQTYSLYFNAEAVLQATDGLSPRLTGVPIENKTSLFYNYYKFAFDKIKLSATDSAPDPIGIYRADSFNEYGDVSVERENNIMNNACDENMLITVGDTLLNDEFIDYVNDYIKYAKSQGATVYFNWSPVNASAIRSSKAARSAFEEKLSSLLECELLEDIENCLIDERYFYDTNFHLNSAGAIYFSRGLVLSLKEKLGMEVTTSLEIPDMPELPEEETVVVAPGDEKIPFEEYKGEPNNDYLDAFEYVLSGSTYKIVSIKDDYLAMPEVILPSVYDGKNITAVSEGAFRGCTKLKKIHVGTTYKSFEAGSFNGCATLEGIYFYELDGNKLTPSANGLLDGASRKATIYVPEGANYTTGYTWSNYADRIETFKTEE